MLFYPILIFTYICRDEQPHIQQEFPEEPREPQHKSSEPHGLLEKGTPGRRKLGDRKISF